MSEVNYNETVVIPVLQKKYQDLMNSNLVLEINLLVEQTKNRDLQQKLDNAMSIEQTKNTDLQQKLDNAITKIETLKKNGKKKEEGLDGSTY
jgi:hypothetical protein